MGKREAQWGFCAVPCSVTQARSGSHCQEKLAWKYCISPRGRGFQTIPSRVLFYFFPLLFLSLSSSQAVSLSQRLAGFPAPPCASRPLLSQLSLPRLRAGCFPPGEGLLLGGRVVAQEGTIPASPALEEQGHLGGSLGWRLGYRGAGHPGRTSHLQIPKSHPCPPNRAAAHSPPGPQPWQREGAFPGAAEPGRGMLTGIPGMVGCYRRDPRLLSTDSMAATGEGPVSSCPGSGVSQPCSCQMAPEVPRWGGDYGPKSGQGGEGRA